jgi:hypothetical protein
LSVKIHKCKAGEKYSILFHKNANAKESRARVLSSAALTCDHEGTFRTGANCDHEGAGFPTKSYIWSRHGRQLTVNLERPANVIRVHAKRPRGERVPSDDSCAKRPGEREPRGAGGGGRGGGERERRHKTRSLGLRYLRGMSSSTHDQSAR